MDRDLACVNFRLQSSNGSVQQGGKRGRPELISESDLRAAYADLISVLSQHWAAVGWELRTVTTVSQIRESLRNIKGITCSRLEVFMRAEMTSATGTQIAQTRSELLSLSEEIHKAYQTRSKHAEIADWAKRAVKGAQNPYQMEELRPKAEVRRRMLNETNELIASLTEEIDAHRHRIEQQEAYFAQNQLLKFILSNRRALTPRSFAAAMAGLPFISWRQSSERCADYWKLYPESFIYKMFMVVAKVCEKTRTGPGPLVEELGAYICEPMRDDASACQQFRDNWHFLESAVRAVSARDTTPADSLPYRIFAEYQRRWQCQSAMDVLLNEERRL